MKPTHLHRRLFKLPLPHLARSLHRLRHRRPLRRRPRPLPPTLPPSSLLPPLPLHLRQPPLHPLLRRVLPPLHRRQQPLMIPRPTLLAVVFIRQIFLFFRHIHAQVVLPGLALVAADHGEAELVLGRGAAHAADDRVGIVVFCTFFVFLLVAAFFGGFSFAALRFGFGGCRCGWDGCRGCGWGELVVVFGVLAFGCAAGAAWFVCESGTISSCLLMLRVGDVCGVHTGITCRIASFTYVRMPYVDVC